MTEAQTPPGASTKAIHFKDGGRGRTAYQKRLLLFRRQGGLCAICCKPMGLHQHHGQDAATLDHIIPRSKGGGNLLTNLRVAHRRCNEERRASLSDVFVDAGGVRALRWSVKELP